MALSWPLERHCARRATDAAIVLGTPLREDGSLTDVGEERVKEGVNLWKAGLAPMLCMTGGAGTSTRIRRTEAEAMGELAIAMGVPADRIVLETKARNTRENAIFSGEKLLPTGCRRIWVVTQPFHTRRAVLWFRRAGFEAWGWHIENSIQYRKPVRAVRWVVREYGSWIKMGVLEVRDRVQGYSAKQRAQAKRKGQ